MMNETSEKISVVIPNWNGCALTLQCLGSLRNQVYDDFKVYVVDNGSSDGSVERIRAEFPEVTLVENSENLGFAGGVNSGIRVAKGEYIALLNNDTEAHPEWLTELVKFLDANPQFGFAASKVLVYGQRELIDSFGDGYTFKGLSFKICDLELDDGRYECPVEVFAASGAASVYRRSMLNDIGLFDEDFFAYMEDVEISIRAQLAGYRCIAIPSAIIYHMVSASTGGDTSRFSVQMTVKNIFNVLVRNIPGPLLIFMVPLSILAQSSLIFLSLCTNKYPGIRRNLPGYALGIGGAFQQFPAMLNKRKKMKDRRRISTIEFFKRIRYSGLQKKTIYHRSEKSIPAASKKL